MLIAKVIEVVNKFVMMNYLDIIICIPIAFGIYKGFQKGLIIEISTLLGLILGIYGAIMFSSATAAYLADFIAVDERFMPYISFFVSFIAIVIGVHLLAKLLEKLLDLAALKTANKVAGAVFGMIKATIIVSVAIYLLEGFNRKVQFLPDSARSESIVYAEICNITAPLYTKLLDSEEVKKAEKKATELI